ncbi:unnamed protein product [Rhizophagus irregularis]|nr:unnamed protein product [Rhizophagus irregularis]
MKPLRFCKAETSLILTKFRYESLHCHSFILNKKGLNNLIMKPQYNCYSLNKNATTRNNEDTITTPSEPSATKNGLTNFPPKDAKNKNELLTERIFEITKMKIKNTQHALNIASKSLNELTGYSVIEKLKEKVIQQEKEFVATRQRLASAKLAYEEAVAKRSATQREINELLQRKHQWSNDDVMKFTELYRNEHLNEKMLTEAKEELHKYEKQVEKEYTELSKSIMMRYHEEQVWSDKIRSASTYGTIALMTLNIILFICVQTIFEPRKRQKLAEKFEELLIKKLDKNEETGIFQQLYHKYERMDEKISKLLTDNNLYPIKKHNESIVEFETNQNNLEIRTENELIDYDNLLKDSEKSIIEEETYDPKNDIILTRGELDKIIILSTLMGAGAGWLLSFIFTERFNR